MVVDQLFRGVARSETGAVVTFCVVTKLFPGRDGVARSALVRTSSGMKTRAVQRLHDLEVLDHNS